MKNEIYNKIICKFDSKKLEQIKNKYNIPASDGRLKYFRYEFEFDTKINFAGDLDLQRKSPKTILDISCGMGYFAYVCKTLGHKVTVTDIDDDLYDEVRRDIFGFEKIKFEYPFPSFVFAPLPSDIGVYDIITALSVIPMSWWKEQDWKSFIEDSFKHLNTGGILYIRPNRCKEFEDFKTYVRQSGIKNSLVSADYVKLEKV